MFSRRLLAGDYLHLAASQTYRLELEQILSPLGRRLVCSKLATVHWRPRWLFCIGVLAQWRQLRKVRNRDRLL